MSLNFLLFSMEKEFVCSLVERWQQVAVKSHSCLMSFSSFLDMGKAAGSKQPYICRSLLYNWSYQDNFHSSSQDLSETMKRNNSCMKQCKDFRQYISSNIHRTTKLFHISTYRLQASVFLWYAEQNSDQLYWWQEIIPL